MRTRLGTEHRAAPRLRWLTLAACALLALGLALAFTAPPAAAAPVRPAHALPVRTDPPANAILKTPPTQVRMWFSEALNPLASRIIVVDPTNHEVDERDSRVDMTSQTEARVGLQLLRPGAYVVVWRAQSLDDGHVTGGSYIFRIQNADGSVPPIPAVLPTGNVPGAAGFGAAPEAVDGPTLLQALGDWLALLCALFWVGGVFWEEFTLPERNAPGAFVAWGARLAAWRFQRLAPWALGGALLADVLVALALTVQVAGSWRGALIPQFWQAALFSGSFGAYWWMRQVVLLLALVALRIEIPVSAIPDHSAPGAVAEPGVPGFGTPLLDFDAITEAASDIPPWPRAALDVIRQTPALPRRLIRGARSRLRAHSRPLARQVELALGLLLLFAFAMSGHAAATPPSERAYAVAVDLAHLIFSATWLGGLFYISLVLIPASHALHVRVQALLLARGVPEFSVVAIISAAALALTGSLNATVHLTSLSQFATTAYGRVLFVKIELFLIMVAVSAFHAFWLRPRLARALALSEQAPPRQTAGVSAGSAGRRDATQSAEELAGAGATPTLPRVAAMPPTRAAQNGHFARGEDETTNLRRHMEDWLRREAILGVGVLLCVALLALFAGSLTPAQASVPARGAITFSQTHTVSGYTITLRVDPATFGQNTFTVTVADARGKPVTGASAQLLANDLDMDMGQQSVQAQPVAAQPGVYSAQGQLTMAGRWNVTVKVLPPGAQGFITTDFTLIAGS